MKGNMSMQMMADIMQKSEKIEISIVVPVFNEELVLSEFYNRITSTLQPIRKSYEIIFVDDGSQDSSPEFLKKISETDKHVMVIRFSRNFGHHIALTAGLDYSNGDLIVMMDADLQDKPEELPKLLKKIDEGYDVAFAINRKKQSSFFRRTSSFLFNRFMNRLVNFPVPLNTNIFRVMRRRVVENLNKFRERERFIVGMVSYLGFRQIGVLLERDKRPLGKSKYSLLKMIRLGINTITSFSYIPLQLASVIGLICIIASLFIGVNMSLHRYSVFALEPWKLLFLLMIFVSGVQFILIGILGEYIGRIYSETQNRPLYVIDYIISRRESE